MDAEVLPALWAFVCPLLPWILISVVAPLVRFRLDKQLWLYNKKHHATHRKPKFAKYRNAIVNCMLIVLLGGMCKLAFAPTIGVTIVSNVVMIVFAAVQVVKCLNAYLKIENVGFRFSLFNIFKNSSVKDYIEREEDSDDTAKG